MLEQIPSEVRHQPDAITRKDLEFEEGRPVDRVLRVVRRPGDQPRLLQEVLDVRSLDGAGGGLEKFLRQDAEGGVRPVSPREQPFQSTAQKTSLDAKVAIPDRSIERIDRQCSIGTGSIPIGHKAHPTYLIAPLVNCFPHLFLHA